MKKKLKTKLINIYLIQFFIMLSVVSFSQTQSNVFTPKGSTVEAYIFDETTANRASWDNY